MGVLQRAILARNGEVRYAAADFTRVAPACDPKNSFRRSRWERNRVAQQEGIRQGDQQS